MTAPPREAAVKQRTIHGASIPFVAKKSALDPVPVTITLPDAKEPDDASAQAATAAQPGDNKATPKAQSAPKRQKALQRQPPVGTRLEAQDKDGNCMYRTMACALNRRRTEPSFHHLELRARVATHIQGHPEWYCQAWKDDGSKGPDGKPCADWETFVKEISKPGSYSGDIELRALCKLTKTKVVLIPEDANFPVVVYGKKWASSTHCFFYSSNHFDYLAPTGEVYPKDLLDVEADPCGGFLVGGISELVTESASSGGGGTRAADLRTEPSSGLACVAKTKKGRPKSKNSAKEASFVVPSPRMPSRALGSASSAGRARSVGTVQDVDAVDETGPPSGHARPQRRLVPPPEVAEMLRKNLFKCRLCAFKKRGTSRAQLLTIKAWHMKQHHPGHPVLNTLRGVHTARLVQVGPDDEVAWKCPLCNVGISKEEAATTSRSVTWHLKLDHRGLKHPRISKERWKEILRDQRRKQGTNPKLRAKRRINQISKTSLARVSARLPEHCVPFLWPTPVYAKPGSKVPGQSRFRARQCCFKSWIKCRRCGIIFNEKPELHTGATCTQSRKQSTIDRQVERTESLREWLGR